MRPAPSWHRAATSVDPVVRQRIAGRSHMARGTDAL